MHTGNLIYKGLRTALLTTTIFMAAATTSYAQSGLNDNKVLRDRQGDPVYSQGYDNCVRTRWEEGTDVCAPAAPKPQPVAKAPVAAPAPSPARSLSLEQRTVYFDFDKSGIKATEKAKLDSLSEVLRKAEDVQSADIVGYADRIGSDSYNVTLSEKRAKEVEKYLNNTGYLNTRVTEVRGLGETSSVTKCSEKTKRAEQIECLAPDRRVEIEIKFLEKPAQ